MTNSRDEKSPREKMIIPQGGIGQRFDSLKNGEMKARLGIMGGTFDPIHNAHLRIAEEIREELDLDGVLFIPAGNPIFKKDQKVSDPKERLEQVKKAIESNPHFEVDDCEINRVGATYTIDTIKYLREKYPPCIEFYFIVGSDTAESICKWRDVDQLAKLMHLVVALGRPYSKEEQALRKIIEYCAPFDIHFVKTSILEISSHDIRERIENNKSTRYLLPSEIVIGTENELFESQGDKKALEKSFYKERKADLKQRLSSKRYEHSIGVAKTAFKLAKRYGVDPRKAKLAGLLHDWDKCFNQNQARKRIYELGMEDEVHSFVVEHMPIVLHGKTAARALAKEFKEIPGDVLQAIDRHTTAAENMSDLDKIIYVADAIEPSRQYEGIKELRKMSNESSLDELYYKTYRDWNLVLMRRGKPLHPDTINIWNSYSLNNI